MANTEEKVNEEAKNTTKENTTVDEKVEEIKQETSERYEIALEEELNVSHDEMENRKPVRA